MRDDLKRKALQCRAGVFDPFEAHRKRPLSEHVAQYRKQLEAKRNSVDHVARTIQRIESIIDGCGSPLGREPLALENSVDCRSAHLRSS